MLQHELPFTPGPFTFARPGCPEAGRSWSVFTGPARQGEAVRVHPAECDRREPAEGRRPLRDSIIRIRLRPGPRA